MIPSNEFPNIIKLLQANPQEFDQKVKQLSREYQLSPLEVIQQILEHLEPELQDNLIFNLLNSENLEKTDNSNIF
jgi:hypothetical protein